VETYLPPQSKDKSEVAMHTAGISDTKVQGGDVHDHSSYVQIKLTERVVTDLVKKIPILFDTEPERVFNFLVRASEVHRLNLVTDEEFLALLVARTTGWITQVFGVHLSASSNLGLACSEILSTFLSLRIREGFLSKCVLDRFQFATEELSQFVMSVVTAADKLGYEVPESVLVHHMVQHINPNVRPLLLRLNPNPLRIS
jgi:hypothetical protein